MDGALCVPLSAGPAAGATACPKAGVAAAAAKITNSRKVRRTMLSSLRQRRAYLLKHGGESRSGASDGRMLGAEACGG
jgi:hypothetical protein